MLTQFHCTECHHEWEGDDTQTGFCPECGHGQSEKEKYRRLSEHECAVRLDGLRMTQQGLSHALSYLVPSGEKPRGWGAMWKGERTIEGQTWGIILFIEPRD